MYHLNVKSDSRFIAIDTSTQDILFEGQDPAIVSSQAEASGKDFIMSYVPEEAQTYIF